MLAKCRKIRAVKFYALSKVEIWHKNIKMGVGTPVADPGFPRGGGANPKGGAPTYYLANFS